MNDFTVTLNKSINAPVEVVFDAWLNPKTMASFMMPMEGMPEPEVKINAIVDGSFSIIMEVEGNKLPHSGKYIEIERSNKLVFTWISPFSPNDSIVSLLFTKIDDTTTNIELTHTKFEDEESRKNHEGGWTGILNTLSKLYL